MAEYFFHSEKPVMVQNVQYIDNLAMLQTCRMDA